MIALANLTLAAIHALVWFKHRRAWLLETVTGHGGFDQITCMPYEGKPL